LRLVIAECQVDYAGRLTAHLPMATRLILVKSDGSVSIHNDDRAYKPLNWMSPPCTLREETDADGVAKWTVTGKDGGTLRILLREILHDSSHDLGVDPGLQKDGVEKHLQALLAEHPSSLAEGMTLVRREYPTAIGPVDLLCRDGGINLADGEVDTDSPPGNEPSDADGTDGVPASTRHVAVEVKRRATIDAVEQLSRYLELLNRDPLLAPVRGILAAQTIAPQARTLAEDRRMTCVVVDYDALRGMDSPEERLF
jgi:endonuclease